MSPFRTGSLTLLAVFACLGTPTTSRGEDLGLPPILFGSAELASTRTNGFVAAMPGGRFVVTVAYLAPVPSSTTGGNNSPTCESAQFRVDTLTVKPSVGTVDVALGVIQRLAPGQSVQIVHDVDPRTGVGMPTWDLDLMGFRLKSENTASRCGLVASAQFYPSSTTTAPISVAIIPDLGSSPRVGSSRGR